MSNKNYYKDFDNKKILSVKADEILQGIAVDCVILGFHQKTLKILLNKFVNYERWMLPGGFIFKDENIDDAAHRILRIRTGLNNMYLRQFYVFGQHQRVDPEESMLSLLTNEISPEQAKNHWIFQRFISAGYYALVDYTKVEITNSSLDETKWFNIEDVPEKLFGDHKLVLEVGLNAIREHLNSIPIDYELLPEKFTMSELRSIYETLLEKKLDRRNFQKKMLQMGYIIKLDETRGDHKFKSTTLFSFDKEKYETALKNSTIYFAQKDKV